MNWGFTFTFGSQFLLSLNFTSHLSHRLDLFPSVCSKPSLSLIYAKAKKKEKETCQGIYLYKRPQCKQLKI